MTRNNQQIHSPHVLGLAILSVSHLDQVGAAEALSALTYSTSQTAVTDLYRGRMVAPSSQKVYVISGASRGLGLGLVAGLMKQDSTAVVVAAARDPDKSEALQKLVKRFPERIHTVVLDTGDEVSVKVWLQSLGKLAFWCSQTSTLD